MVNTPTSKSNLPIIETIAVIIISYGYANLSTMFVLQHLISPTFHIPTLLVLIGILFLPIRSALRAMTRTMILLPLGVRGGFVVLMALCGVAFYVLGPVIPPDTAGWADVSIRTTLQPLSKLVTIIIVGGFGLGFLLTTAIGTVTPILPRFISVTLFFCIYLIIGLLIYADYGMSVDEIFERETSLVSANYVVQNFNADLAIEWFGNDIKDIRTYRDRHYGVAFQLPLALIETMNGLDDDISDAWIYRHFAVFVFYFCGVVVFYRFAYEKFSSWQLGLLGAVLLVFTPHIFGQTFNNIKDPVFVSAFTMALYCGFRYWRHKTTRNAIIFGAVAAFASNVRIVAIFVIIFVVLYVILLELLSPKSHSNKRTKRQTLLTVGAILMTYFPLQVLFFPASWSNPLYFNMETLVVFAKYSKWDGYIIYMGEWIRGQEAPWHYLPVWLTMTIPLTYQVLFAIGAVAIVRLAIRERSRLLIDEKREEVAMLVLFITPIMALIGLGATMYNDWRQFYFLYIPFLMVVLYAIKLLWEMYINPETGVLVKRGLLGFLLLVGIYQAFLVYWIVANHPYQNIFRTTPIVELFGGRSHFDHDMSRAAARQGYEYVLNIDDSNPLPICVINGTIDYGAQILPQAEIERIEWVNCEDSARYAINIYRDPFLVYDPPLPPAIYNITVDGLTILSVYQLIP